MSFYNLQNSVCMSENLLTMDGAVVMNWVWEQLDIQYCCSVCHFLFSFIWMLNCTPPKVLQGQCFCLCVCISVYLSVALGRFVWTTKQIVGAENHSQHMLTAVMCSLNHATIINWIFYKIHDPQIWIKVSRIQQCLTIYNWFTFGVITV